jgi:8-oxo-dGTP diphosphatase
MMSSAAQPAVGEHWTICTLGHVHWGAHGGAGLLLRHISPGSEARYLLALRSRLVDEPARWGIPGGAIRDGESPEAAARREMREEIGYLPPYGIVAEEVQECGGGWQFHIFLADVKEMFDAYSVLETDATGWFTTEEMRTLPLHSGVLQWLDQLGTRRPEKP